MTLINDARVRQNLTTTGTGALTLGSAVSGQWIDVGGVAASGDVGMYFLKDANGTNWEKGIGTSDGTTGWTRTAVLEGTSGTSPINLSAGTHEFWIIDWPGICTLGEWSAGGVWNNEFLGAGSGFANTGSDSNTRGLFPPCAGYLFNFTARRRLTTEQLTLEVYIEGAGTGVDVVIDTDPEDQAVLNTTEHVAVTAQQRVSVRLTQGAGDGTARAVSATVLFAPSILL